MKEHDPSDVLKRKQILELFYVPSHLSDIFPDNLWIFNKFIAHSAFNIQKFEVLVICTIMKIDICSRFPKDFLVKFLSVFKIASIAVVDRH